MRLEAAAAPHHPDQTEAIWDGYIDLLAVLHGNGKRGRGGKTPRSALKTPGTDPKPRGRR